MKIHKLILRDRKAYVKINSRKQNEKDRFEERKRLALCEAGGLGAQVGGCA